MAKRSLVDDFTPTEELVPVGVDTAPPPTEAHLKQSDEKISGIDFKSLQDDVENLDESPLPGGELPSTDLERFVFAKFINAPLSVDRNLTCSVNGVKAMFPRGKWVLSQFKFIDAARKSGVLDFIHNEAGERMRPVPNHPTIQIQEIPAEYRSVENIAAFKALCDKARKTPTEFAHSTW